MTMHDASEVRAALEAAFPCLDEPFERAWHLQETAAVLQDIAQAYAAESAGIAADLYAAGLKSPTYEVTVQTKIRYIVDISKLKDELPQVAEGLLYLSGPNAVKLIGEHRLYELAVEIAGASRVALLEQVRIEDMRKSLLPEELGRYVSEEEKPSGLPMIICREGDTNR